MNHAWATAKKYADGDVDLRVRGKRKRESTVIGPFEHIIDAWLEEDSRRPAKQRRTAQKVYVDLLDLGYSGSDRTVRNYVRKRKLEMSNEMADQFVRLEHAPGTAQADFGQFKAIHNGQEVTCHFLTLSFPYSNAQAAVVLPAENAACFLHGLETLFEYIGGVPSEIWFDNLSVAVEKVLKGSERELTQLFKSFRWHYRFKSIFCNPGRGNEKGHVENKIGYIRRNFLTPLPVIDDFETFNADLKERLAQDLNRIHYAKKVPIAKLWEDDQSRLLTLPNTPFDIARFHSVTVNKYGEIKVDDQAYHVPSVSPGRKVLVKAYWDRLEVLDDTGEAHLHTCPRDYMKKAKDIDWAAELEPFVRRPRAIEYASYLKALPQGIKDYLIVSDLCERRKRIETMVCVLRDYSVDIAVVATGNALQYNRTDKASVLSFAAYADDVEGPLPIDEPWTPGEVAQWSADLGAYDRLVMSRG